VLEGIEYGRQRDGDGVDQDVRGVVELGSNI
jgi:hypothetical protein